MPEIMYHTCGARVTIIQKWNGMEYFPVQIDKDGEEIGWDCPDCGEYIFHNELLSEKVQAKIKKLNRVAIIHDESDSMGVLADRPEEIMVIYKTGIGGVPDIVFGGPDGRHIGQLNTVEEMTDAS